MAAKGVPDSRLNPLKPEQERQRKGPAPPERSVLGNDTQGRELFSRTCHTHWLEGRTCPTGLSGPALPPARRSGVHQLPFI